MPLIGSLLSSAGKVCDSTNRFMNEYSLPATVLAIVGVLLNIGLLTYFTNPKLKNSSIVEDVSFITTITYLYKPNEFLDEFPRSSIYYFKTTRYI